MNNSSNYKIQSNTKNIIEFIDLPDRIIAISKVLKGTKSEKELIAIAKYLEGDSRKLLNPLYLGAIKILDLLCTSNFMSYEEIGIKTDRGKATVQQIINALKKGGLELQESPARGFKAPTGRPRIGKHL
jgi:biotin operon repressor